MQRVVVYPRKWGGHGSRVAYAYKAPNSSTCSSPRVTGTPSVSQKRDQEPRGSAWCSKGTTNPPHNQPASNVGVHSCGHAVIVPSPNVLCFSWTCLVSDKLRASKPVRPRQKAGNNQLTSKPCYEQQQIKATPGSLVSASSSSSFRFPDCCRFPALDCFH